MPSEEPSLPERWCCGRTVSRTSGPQISLRSETLASHAGQMLADHRYSCLPVVDQDDILCGIVTERDFLKFAIKALSAND